MKEVCGFIDTAGNFHKTQEECEIAEIKIKIKVTKSIFENFESRISNYLFFNYNGETSHLFHKHKNDIFEAVTKAVLAESDKFIAIIREKESLSKDLDILEKEYKDKTFKPWWLRVKW